MKWLASNAEKEKIKQKRGKRKISSLSSKVKKGLIKKVFRGGADAGGLRAKEGHAVGRVALDEGRAVAFAGGQVVGVEASADARARWNGNGDFDGLRTDAFVLTENVVAAIGGFAILQVIY